MLILASQSPRRKELMEKFITSSFSIIPSNIKEVVDPNLPPIEVCKSLAKQKGDHIFLSHPNDTIISSDTIVVLNNKIYGKPKSKEDAFDMLKELSNNTHQIITGYYIKNKDIAYNDAAISYLTIKNVTDDEINEYIATTSPLDKAGAYGIQDKYFSEHFLLSYKGSKNNIIGFPTEDILLILKKYNLV